MTKERFEMQKIQSMIGKAEINRDLVLLLVIGGLYSLGIFMSNTFVNVYLWKQAGDYTTIAMYNLAIFLFQPLAFIVAGKMAKKGDRIIDLRLGVIFLSLFFLSVLFIGEYCASYHFIVGSFLGIVQSVRVMLRPVSSSFLIPILPVKIGCTVIFATSIVLVNCAVTLIFFLNRRQAEGHFYVKQGVRQWKHSPLWRKILNAHV